jgi:hypothetical protein
MIKIDNFNGLYFSGSPDDENFLVNMKRDLAVQGVTTRLLGK